jgi:hypothetical protein
MVRNVLQFVPLERAMNVENIANQHVVERHGIGPSVFTGGSQHTMIRASQNFASFCFGNRPVAPSYLSKRHRPQPLVVALASRPAVLAASTPPAVEAASLAARGQSR